MRKKADRSVSKRRKKSKSYKKKLNNKVVTHKPKLGLEWTMDNIVNTIKKYLIDNDMSFDHLKSILYKVTGYTGSISSIEYLYKMGKTDVLAKMNILLERS